MMFLFIHRNRLSEKSSNANLIISFKLASTNLVDLQSSYLGKTQKGVSFWIVKGLPFFDFIFKRVLHQMVSVKFTPNPLTRKKKKKKATGPPT